LAGGGGATLALAGRGPEGGLGGIFAGADGTVEGVDEIVGLTNATGDATAPGVGVVPWDVELGGSSGPDVGMTPEVYSTLRAAADYRVNFRASAAAWGVFGSQTRMPSNSAAAR
jgi:hypothetical protein